MDELHQAQAELGALYVKFQRFAAEYEKLLGLVRRIQSGEVNAADVVLLPGSSWEIRPPANSSPATLTIETPEDAAPSNTALEIRA